MLKNLHKKIELFHLMDEGALVITPNNRLSEALLKDYFQHTGKNTLPKPRCLPYRQALQQAYQTLQAKVAQPLLLNTTQANYLWRQLLQNEPNLHYSEGLLQTVFTAWEHCLQWGLKADDERFHYTQQSRQFQQWWQRIEKQLQQQHWLTEQQIIPFLMNIEQPIFKQTLIWACFDTFSPQQLLLQQHHSSPQYQYDLKSKATITYCFSAKDSQEEQQGLREWLERKLNQNAKSIAVIIPDLQQKASQIVRFFNKHFDSSAYNLSLGKPLNQFPIIAHALCWLSLDAHEISTHTANLLLQSPFLEGAEEEHLYRSDFLHQSPLLQQTKIKWPQWLAALKTTTPKLHKLLSAMHSFPLEASVQEWIGLFQGRLNFFKFPGKNGLNSENYQCLNRFILLFDEFQQISLIKPSMTQKEALDAFEHLAQHTIFQAQKNQAPIQISGLLEASGCEFENIWLMGLTDQCLPQKVKLCAFIPHELQQSLHMPHSSAERELELAQQILNRVQYSTDELVVSYPKLQKDNPNLACTLITEFPPYEFHLKPSIEQEMVLIPLEEDYKIPLKAQEVLSGNTALLANQAKCPFKAFAEHRLQAKAALQMIDGLGAQERGQLIHKAMEYLWKQLQQQDTLFTLTPQELEQHIDEALKQTLHHLPTTQQELEHIRLKRLIEAHLEWEKQRPPFKVATIEEAYTFQLAGMPFKIRVDRIDEVADKKWLIDYKSTLPSTKPWYEERPQEPQLLLYALLDTKIQTLLFLQLKTGKLLCSGLSEEKQDLKGISTIKKESSWEEHREEWQQELTLLAEEFQQGHCAPTPASKSLCQRCDFRALCRFTAS